MADIGAKKLTKVERLVDERMLALFERQARGDANSGRTMAELAGARWAANRSVNGVQSMYLRLGAALSQPVHER
jgi:hypothetical protein